MSVMSMPVLTDQSQETHIIEAAEELGRALRTAPEFQVFLAALETVNNDAHVHRLSAQIREHTTDLQWGQGDASAHQAALAQLRQELENAPGLRAYRQAEQAAVRLSREVDQLVTQTAGVAFAANAKPSSCGCGG